MVYRILVFTALVIAKLAAGAEPTKGNSAFNSKYDGASDGVFTTTGTSESKYQKAGSGNGRPASELVPGLYDSSGEADEPSLATGSSSGSGSGTATNSAISNAASSAPAESTGSSSAGNTQKGEQVNLAFLMKQGLGAAEATCYLDYGVAEKANSGALGTCLRAIQKNPELAAAAEIVASEAQAKSAANRKAAKGESGSPSEADTYAALAGEAGNSQFGALSQLLTPRPEQEEGIDPMLLLMLMKNGEGEGNGDPKNPQKADTASGSGDDFATPSTINED